MVTWPAAVMEVLLISRLVRQQPTDKIHMGRILVTCPIHTEVC
jgi:hypothetical protein